MEERELIKIACDNEIGYYTQFKDAMKEGEKEYVEGAEPTPLTVAEIKEKLKELDVEIPDGVTLKADLQELLDNALSLK
ncbi:hypothetical protein KAR91_26090 [Candidatus Pacearchaeota archaeon]|nr:hypothetical protein [Candidatus Pacearchaeota archaeon]